MVVRVVVVVRVEVRVVVVVRVEIRVAVVVVVESGVRESAARRPPTLVSFIV